MYKIILLFYLSISIAYAEDMIDPRLISKIDCPEPVVKLAPKIKPITYVGYHHKEHNYSINTVHVNTYVLVEIGGVWYRKHMVFSNNKWEDVLIKE